MLVAYHQKYDENNKIISDNTEVVDEPLYNVQKRKKSKLVTELRTEKIIDPSIGLHVDEAIENIRKCKIGTYTVGNVSCHYTFLKGFYFYIHKIIDRPESYVNSVHMYCASHGDKALFQQLMQVDPLFKRKVEN